MLAAGREGDLAWVHWKTGGIYMMHWGNAPSSIVFQALANDLRLLKANHLKGWDAKLLTYVP